MTMKNTGQKKKQTPNTDCRCRSEGGAKPSKSFGVSSAVIYVCLAIIICASLALVEVCLLSAQKQKLLKGSDGEDEQIRIYIDQGHNPLPYHNIGAEGNGLYEQDLTYSIGCLLADLLEGDGRFEVCLSRPDDDTVLGSDNTSSLKARVDGAREFGADYFISLHINSFTQDHVNGIEVFASESDDESSVLAGFLLDGMLESTNLNDRGVKSGAELYVLKNSDMPAVLLEMGFISNAGDAALLSDSPELFAKGIYDGIVDYFESAYILDINILIFTICVATVIAVALKIATVVVRKKHNLKAK